MKEKVTELVFVLDRSGSMSGLESDTIGGFNGLIEKQKKEGQEVYVTTVLFDDKYELLHDHIKIDNVRPLTQDEYYVRGCTALIDALGKTINKMKNIARCEDCRVMFIITTDGLENASKEYSGYQVKKLISQLTESGWEFIFMGANIDAVKTAGDYGIRPERTVNFINDDIGIKKNYEAMSKMVTRFAKKEEFDESDLEEIRRDYKTRKH